jgi:hypothetical protein
VHLDAYNQHRISETDLFFLTSKTGEEKALWLGWIIPDESISFTWFSTSSFMAGENLYGLIFTG